MKRSAPDTEPVRPRHGPGRGHGHHPAQLVTDTAITDTVTLNAGIAGAAVHARTQAGSKAKIATFERMIALRTRRVARRPTLQRYPPPSRRGNPLRRRPGGTGSQLPVSRRDDYVRQVVAVILGVPERPAARLGRGAHLTSSPSTASASVSVGVGAVGVGADASVLGRPMGCVCVTGR